MTEEELNRIEALAIGVNIERFDAGWYASAKIGSVVGKDAEFIAAVSPATILSLIRLARVGLAASQGTIGHMDNGKTALTAAVLQVSALPKPGDE